MTKEELLQFSNESLRQGNKVRRSVFQSLIAECEKIEKMKKTPNFISILQKKIEEKKESITYAIQAGRTDIHSNAQTELEILESFLPPQLTEKEVIELITDVKKQNEFTSIKDIKNALRIVTLKVAGRYDATKLVSLTFKIISNGN